jgi:hypothetical protein
MDIVSVYDDDEEFDVEYRTYSLTCRHLVRNKRIFQSSAEIVKKIRLFEGYKLLQLFFDTQYNFWEAYHSDMVTKEILTGELDIAVFEGNITTEEHEQGVEMLNSWWDEQEYSVEFVIDVIQEARVKYLQKEALERNAEGEEFSVIINDAKKELDSDPFGRAKQASGLFSNPERYLKAVKSYQSGVSFVDSALDGGAQKGDFIGFVIPSGHGKTTMGLQIAAAQVEQNRHAIILQTEQDIEGDIALRTYVQATKLERKYWKNGWEGASRKVRKRFNEVKDKWETYFHIFPLRDAMPKSIDELFSYVEEVKSDIERRNRMLHKQADAFIDKYNKVNSAKKEEMLDKLLKTNQPLHKQVAVMLEGKPFEGEELVYVILDWWGDVRDALMEHAAGSKSEAAARRASRTWLKELKAKCSPEHFDCVNIVFQQLAGDAATKAAGRAQSSHSAQEDKNFNNRMDFCFTFSVMDSNQVLKVVSDKARRYRRLDCMAKLEGELCMFKEVKDPDKTYRALTEAIDEADDDASSEMPEDNREIDIASYEGTEDDDIDEGNFE